MGTPGAGKSSVIKEFKSKHPDSIVINFGTIMFEIAQRDYGVENRDDMRKLDRAKFRELQSKAATEIMKRGKDVIIDTHASINTVDGYHPGFPNYVLSKFNIDAFIYIYAPIDTIISRRQRDVSRKRDVESIEQIRFHEDINFAMVCSCANFANAPIKFIKNEDGKLDEAIRQFEDCVRLVRSVSQNEER
jgi:adenylate kinase